MGVLEIFRDENGRMVYTETNKICHDSLGSWVPARFAIRVADLVNFLAIPDDEVIMLSPDCPERDPRLVPLKPSYKVSDIDSLVVFDTWRKTRTPAIALYERGDGSKLTLAEVYPDPEDIPQRFWEIWYPLPCARITAKVRQYFQFHLSQHSFWYFVGAKTQFLYIVIPEESRVMIYNDYCGINIGRDDSETKELGVRDGLNPSGFCKIDEFYGFTLDALEGTNYHKRRLDTPEDIMSLAQSNIGVGHILIKILAKDEWNLLRYGQPSIG